MSKIAVAILVIGLACGSGAMRMSRAERERVHARVEGLMPSAESALYVRVTLIFENDTNREVRVRQYRIVWNGGSFTSKPPSLKIGPKSSRVWTTRIGPEHGNLQELLDHGSTATVEVE